MSVTWRLIKVTHFFAWFGVLFHTNLGYAKEATSFDTIRTFLKTSVDNQVVAGGSVIVYHQGKIVFQEGFGYFDLKTKKPFEVNTPCVIASVSKPLLGTTLHHLADNGKVKLSVPITTYLPEFADRKLESGKYLKRPPTVLELLTHSSGLRHDDAAEGKIWYQPWVRGQKLELVVKKVAQDFPFKSQPGTRFAYSGIGTDVAARISEVATGLPRNQMLQKHLCEPLGMSSTFYRDSDGLKKHGFEMPTRYHISSETKTLAIARGRTIAEKDRYSSSGGSVISTAPDLLTWLLMIRNGGVHAGDAYLTPQMHADLLRPQGMKKNAGGGLFIRERDDDGKPFRFGHTGSSGTNVWIDFRTDTIGIMLTQTRGADIRPFRRELERMVDEVVTVEEIETSAAFVSP